MGGIAVLRCSDDAVVAVWLELDMQRGVREILSGRGGAVAARHAGTKVGAGDVRSALRRRLAYKMNHVL